MSDWDRALAWFVLWGIPIILSLVAYTALYERNHLKEEITSQIAKIELLECPMATSTPEIVREIVTVTTTEPFDDTQLTQLQEDNIWCFGEKDRIEGELSATISTLEGDLATCNTNLENLKLIYNCTEL